MHLRLSPSTLLFLCLLVFWGCSHSVRYAIKLGSLPLDSCPSQKIVLKTYRFELPTSDPRFETTQELSLDTLPISRRLFGPQSNTLLLAETPSDEILHAKIWCETGKLLFDSEKTGFSYHDSAGKRHYVLGADNVHYLDEPFQKKIRLEKIPDED